METIGARLRGDRERAGLRPADMATALGVSRQVLYQWETDRRPIPNAQLQRVCGLLADLNPIGDLLAAVMLSSDEGLTADEARAASPHLGTAALAGLTTSAGPLRWTEATRPDARGRRYTRRVLVLADTPDAPNTEAELTGAAVLGLRLVADLTREQLADRLGITPVALAQWERGERAIPAGRCAALLELLPAATGPAVQVARVRVGLGVNELARAAPVPASDLSRWERELRGAPAPATVLRIAAAVAAASSVPRTLPSAAAWAALEQALTTAGADGLDHTRLMLAAKRGRRGEQSSGVTDQVRRRELGRRVRTGYVVRFGVLVPTQHGGRRAIPRYALASLSPRPPELMRSEELRQRMKASGQTGSWLAGRLGVSKSAVSIWLTRPAGQVDGRWAGPIRELLPSTELPDLDACAEVRLLAACRDHPGTRAEVVRAAGYGKENATALAALARLIERNQVHRDWIGAPHPTMVYRSGPGAVRVTGTDVRRRRGQLGLSLAQVGKLLGASPSAVHLWEANADEAIPQARWTSIRQALQIN